MVSEHAVQNSKRVSFVSISCHILESTHPKLISLEKTEYAQRVERTEHGRTVGLFWSLWTLVEYYPLCRAFKYSQHTSKPTNCAILKPFSSFLSTSLWIIYIFFNQKLFDHIDFSGRLFCVSNNFIIIYFFIEETRNEQFYSANKILKMLFFIYIP